MKDETAGQRRPPGRQLQAFFKDMQKTYPHRRRRGKGLMAAIEIVKPGTASPTPVRQGVRRRGPPSEHHLMARHMGNCVRFLPPLVVTDADMEHAFGVFTRSPSRLLESDRPGRAAGRRRGGRGSARSRARPVLHFATMHAPLPATGRSTLPSGSATRHRAAGVVYYATTWSTSRSPRRGAARRRLPIPKSSARRDAAAVSATCTYHTPARLDDCSTSPCGPTTSAALVRL